MLRRRCLAWFRHPEKTSSAASRMLNAGKQGCPCWASSPSSLLDVDPLKTKPSSEFGEASGINKRFRSWQTSQK